MDLRAACKKNPLPEIQATDFCTAMSNQNPRNIRDALRHHDPR